MRASKAFLLPALLATLVSAPVAADAVEEYLERYFAFYPGRATAAGRHDLDHRLEDLGRERRQAWARYNQDVAFRMRAELARANLDPETRLDYELLLRQAKRTVFDFDVRRDPERDPLYWTGILSRATVFLLVREDLPRADRLGRVVERARLIPRLAGQAREALSATDDSLISPELTAIAAGQAASSAVFYRQGLSGVATENEGDLRASLQAAGSEAAAALESLAGFLEDLAKRATGSPRLGADYADRFRIVTGETRTVREVLAEAERALAEKRAETAAYGRTVWKGLFGESPAPAGERELIRALFDRVAADRAASVDGFVGQYRNLVEESIEFVRSRDLITLPEPLTLYTGRSPSFFVGQSVGGVYAAGPYADEGSKTLWFLPTPPDTASPEQKDAFFRDFNDHFNVMITPHEIVPGHYLQLKWAARHPHKVRALFGDGVYIEGWGTFCERLMLDLGWGGPLDRLAHLKKQLENISRTIVDIRVHTEGMTRDEVLDYVKNEALQDEQFASNMWTRAITSTPQLTSYYLGYRQVRGLYDDVRVERGEEFDLKSFMDGMMELGPVPVSRYRQRMLGE